MTAVAWLAVLGPIVAGAFGIGIGFFMGKAANAEELGAMQQRSLDLAEQIREARRQIGALAASPPDRRESGRVLDLVTADARG